MPIPLKISLSGGDDPECFYADNLAKEKNLKYKRPLLILLVLGIAVFSVGGNQKNPIAAEKTISKPSSVVPSEGKDVNPVSLPAVRKSDPPKMSTVPSRIDDLELAYEGDKGYLALNRYERFLRAEKSPVRIHKQKVRDTLTAIDKPLALAGRGFDIHRFAPESETARRADINNRLQKPRPKMQRFPEDHLDLQLTQAKGSKDLIFHPSRHALADDNRQLIHREDERADMEKQQVLDDIPETKLLLMEGEKSFLILRRARESLDLLSGNEKINRKKYSRW